MEELLNCTIGEILTLIHCDLEFMDAMIFNVCDFGDQKCPLTNRSCERDCHVHYKSYLRKQRRQAKAAL